MSAVSGIRTVGETFLKGVRPFLLVTAESINIETFNAVFVLLSYTVAGDSPAFGCTVHKDQLVLQRDYHRTAVRVKTELADVEITADLQVTVDSFLKFADFFFDGLFADWAVLDHINQAQSRVENTKGQIKRVLALLKKMREDIDVQIADEKEKQEQLAVETEL